MPQAKLTKAYDYRARTGKMTAYPAGYEGDMPQAHFDAAVAAGVVDGQKPKPKDDGKDTK
jgi:hypothetical protein